MKKRLTAFLLSAVLCLSLIGTAFAATLTEVDDRVDFTLAKDGMSVTVTVDDLQVGRQYIGWSLSVKKAGGDWGIVDYFNFIATDGKLTKEITLKEKFVYDGEDGDQMQLNMRELGIYQAYTGELDQVAAPTFTPASTTFTTSVSVKIESATVDAVVYYYEAAPGTISVPDHSLFAKYTTPILVSKDTTVWAYAAKEGMKDSEDRSADYTKTSGSNRDPVYGGSGGGSSSASRVTVVKSNGGTVTFKPSNPKTGDTVTITVRPNSGYALDSITVVTKSGATVRLTKVDDNTYTFVMPDERVEIRPVFKAVGAPSFSDVPSSHTFYADISWVAAKGYMNGYSDGTFRPSANTTRQALWMVLARIDGADPKDMAAARTWAVNNGVSDGTNPGGAMTRQQMVTMLYRYAQMKGYKTTGGTALSSFTDASNVADYAKDAVSWAVGNGIVQGTTSGALNPGGTASRAHFAAFLHRFCTNTAGIE